jgi:hypothetical protein
MGLYAQSLNQYRGAGGSVKLVEWEGGWRCGFGRDGACFRSNLARAACLWRWVPHTRGTELCMQIQKNCLSRKRVKGKVAKKLKLNWSCYAGMCDAAARANPIQSCPALQSATGCLGCCCRNCLTAKPNLPKAASKLPNIVSRNLVQSFGHQCVLA